jgi:rhodanese-related sulfurtransferase
VLGLLQEGKRFQSHFTLEAFRASLSASLQQAFPGLVFNTQPALCLPTTLNFSVPGVGSSALMNLFDAAGIRVSSGSACSAAKAQPSYVLEAMGLPAWQTASAIRLSFGPADAAAFIEAACARILACGEALRAHGPIAATTVGSAPPAVSNALSAAQLRALLAAQPDTCLVDVREAYEQSLGGPAELCHCAQYRAVPLSGLADQLTVWQAEPEKNVVFFCRSGGRSAQAAHALRQLGHTQCWSLGGGVALWPAAAPGLQ